MRKKCLNKYVLLENLGKFFQHEKYLVFFFSYIFIKWAYSSQRNTNVCTYIDINSALTSFQKRRFPLQSS